MKFLKGAKKPVNDWVFKPTSCEKSAALKNSNVNIILGGLGLWNDHFNAVGLFIFSSLI